MTRQRSFLLALMLLVAGAATGATDVATISHGRAVDLTDHLVPGKYVLFDFYADWCGPCRALEPHLLELAGRHSDRLAVRKVDVINWDSEVAQQYRLRSIPFLVLFGPDGEQLAAGDAGTVLQHLAEALGGGVPGPLPPSGRPALLPLLAVVAAVIVSLVLLRRRRSLAGSDEATSKPQPVPTPVDTAAEPGDPAIWFAVLQGSIEGPFSRRQLDEMARRGSLERDARVRRRGDSEWTDLSDVVG